MFEDENAQWGLAPVLLALVGLILPGTVLMAVVLCAMPCWAT